MPIQKFECPAGYECRGFVFKVYPTVEQVEVLETIEEELRYVWNQLCSRDNTAREARIAHAEHIGAVGPRIPRPDYSGLSPEESKAAKETHHKACSERVRIALAATKHVEGFRRLKDEIAYNDLKYDYQLFGRWICDRFDRKRAVTGAHVLQALAKSYTQYGKGQGFKRFRKAHEAMPLRTRSGDCFELGNFGARRDKDGWYNCQIKFNGLKIRGRLPGRTPWGRVIEGVTLRREADGWWASIKQVVPHRELLTPISGTVLGIDVGLVDLAAFSEPVGGKHTVANTRTIALEERIAGKQAWASQFEHGTPERKKADNSTARLQLRAARHNLHQIYTHIINPVGTFETIAIEDLNSKIGQMGSRLKSSMRTVAKLLVERYGDRVRAVDCRYTSQDCSQCGHRSKESWSYAQGRYGTCPACGYHEHRDVNAARNVAAKIAKSVSS